MFSAARVRRRRPNPFRRQHRFCPAHTYQPDVRLERPRKIPERLIGGIPLPGLDTADFPLLHVRQLREITLAQPKLDAAVEHLAGESELRTKGFKLLDRRRPFSPRLFLYLTYEILELHGRAFGETV